MPAFATPTTIDLAPRLSGRPTRLESLGLGSQHWVFQTVQPGRRKLAEAVDQRLAPGCRQLFDRRGSDDRGPEGVGDNQAAMIRDQRLRKVLAHRKIEFIAKSPIFRPFLVGPEID